LAARSRHAVNLDGLGAQVRLATATNSRGRPAVAVRRFERVLQVLAAVPEPEPSLLALQSRALLGLATSSFEVGGGLSAALGLLTQAEDLAVRGEAPHLIAGVRNNRGLLLLRSGETREAMVAFDQAAALIDVADPSDRCRILINRGTLHMENGSLAAARSDLARAVRIASAAGERLLEFKSRHNLGYVEFLAGNLPRALADMAAAAELDPGKPHPIVLLDQARVLREAGLGREAMGILEQAAALFRRNRLAQDLGEVELVKAEVALVQDDPAVARRSAEAALRQFRRRNNVRWQRKAELVVIGSEIRAAVLGGLRTRGRRLAVLARQSQQLAELCRAEGREDLARAAALLEADCLLQADLRDRTTLAKVPSLAMSRTDSLTTRLQIRSLRARVAEAGADTARARREIRAGLAELAAHQSGAGSLDLRTAAAVHGVALARQDLALSLRRGRPSDVFVSIERGRATSTRLAPVRPPGDPETAERLARLRQVEEGARAVIGDPARATELASLRAEAASLQQAVRQRSWQREAAVGVDQVAGLASLREVLGTSGAVLVSYVEHAGRWVACVVDRARVRVHDLAPAGMVAELSMRIAADIDALALPAVPDALRERIRTSLASELRQMDDLLLAPIGVADRPLVLTPGGTLALLPWTAMPSRRAVPLVVAPSATRWLQSRATKRPRQSAARVAAVAGPGLLRSADEATSVARIWDAGPAVLGANATVARLRELLQGQADIVHVAAHGVHQTESPLFSSVWLADGPLYAYELDPEHGSAGLVVLSACEVGLSTIRPGDETLGLTSVLLRLGATSVVAGVARVGDELAATVMSGLHRRLAHGTDTATALAETLDELDEPAPFVCFGSSWAS